MNKESIGKQKATVSDGLFFMLAWLTLFSIVAQIFIAGLAVFTDSSYWSSHRNLIHFVEFVPIVMVIVAFVGKLPVALRWQSFAMFALIFVQYFTAHFPGAGATHPVIAVVLFTLALHVAQRSSKQLFRKLRKEI